MSNPYEPPGFADNQVQATTRKAGRSKLAYSLIAGWLSSLIGPTFLVLHWSYYDITSLFGNPWRNLWFFVALYMTPALLCMGVGLLLGHVLQKAGVPVIRSRGLSVTLLAGFVLTYFLANIQLLINDQLNADFLSTPLSLPVFSATCGLGVLITTLLSQFASPSTRRD